MWSPRQVTHLPPVYDILLPLAYTPDRRDQRLLVSHPKYTYIYTISNVESQVFTPNNVMPGSRSAARNADLRHEEEACYLFDPNNKHDKR